MTATVLIPLATGCEELEAVTLIDLLRRADIAVTTTSLDKQKQIRASRGVNLIADTDLESVKTTLFDMVILPGGQPGSDNLSADKNLSVLLTHHAAHKRYVAAICAAPKVLAEAGLLAQHRCTAFPGVLTAQAWPDLDLCDDAIVHCGKIITSRGPGTAMLFALTLIELLTDIETRQRVDASLVGY